MNNISAIQATIGESHLDETSGEMVTISGKVVGIIVYLHVYIIFEETCIGGVMFSVLVSNAVDRGFRAPVRSNQRLSKQVLFNANSAIFHLYHGEK
jgi:hypothetical protein